MKLYLKILSFFIIALYISLSFDFVTTIKLRKIQIEKKFEINNSDKNTNKELVQDDDLIGSFNFISSPHFFPETSLNNNNYDLLGLKYNFTLVSALKILPGQLSLNSEFQLDNISKNIFHNLDNLQKGKKLYAYNILTLSQRLQSSINSAKILNAKLSKLFNITTDYDSLLKPFNLSIYNNTDINEKDVLENTSNNSIITYFIPKTYDSKIFPVHFKFNEIICPKMSYEFKDNLNNKTVKNTYKKLLKAVPYQNNSKYRIHKLIDNDFVKISYNLRDNKHENSNDLTRHFTVKSLYLKSYQNFLEINNFFDFTNKIVKDDDDNSFRKKTLMEMQSNKKPLKNFEFLDRNDSSNEHKLKFLRNIIKKQNEIFDLIKFELFYIKNFSKDFIKISSSEIFKFFMNAIYTYISPTYDEINKNLKNTILTNMFLKDYHLAGIYKILMQLQEKIDVNNNTYDISNLPKIDYGSTITINLMHKKNNLNQEKIIENFYIDILFDFKKIKSLAVSDLIKIIGEYISNDPSFFSNTCN